MTALRPECPEETVLTIGAPGSELIGVLARARASAEAATGVVIVVGGPQTRVGSHRQFVTLARALAQAGHACLRFDYTGMGDSPGPMPDFERAGPDIRRACDALLEAAPPCRRIVLWGLCDGATAALLYAASDPRIAAVIAANPWARSAATRSAALVSGHYGSRLRSPEFWRKLATGKVAVVASAREALGHAWRSWRTRASAVASDDAGLPSRLARALASPRVPVRLQLSGNDLTATEFEIAMKATGALEGPGVSVLRLAQADHTFSAPEALQGVIEDSLRILDESRVARR